MNIVCILNLIHATSTPKHIAIAQGQCVILHRKCTAYFKWAATLWITLELCSNICWHAISYKYQNNEIQRIPYSPWNHYKYSYFLMKLYALLLKPWGIEGVQYQYVTIGSYCLTNTEQFIKIENNWSVYCFSNVAMINFRQ